MAQGNQAGTPGPGSHYPGGTVTVPLADGATVTPGGPRTVPVTRTATDGLPLIVSLNAARLGPGAPGRPAPGRAGT